MDTGKSIDGCTNTISIPDIVVKEQKADDDKEEGTVGSVKVIENHALLSLK